MISPILTPDQIEYLPPIQSHILIILSLQIPSFKASASFSVTAKKLPIIFFPLKSLFNQYLIFFIFSSVSIVLKLLETTINKVFSGSNEESKSLFSVKSKLEIK